MRSNSIRVHRHHLLCFQFFAVAMRKYLHCVNHKFLRNIHGRGLGTQSQYSPCGFVGHNNEVSGHRVVFERLEWTREDGRRFNIDIIGNNHSDWDFKNAAFRNGFRVVRSNSTLGGNMDINMDSYIRKKEANLAV